MKLSSEYFLDFKGKNSKKILANWKKPTIFALANTKNGSVAQLNRVSDYGSEGSRFESWRSHLKNSPLHIL